MKEEREGEASNPGPETDARRNEEVLEGHRIEEPTEEEEEVESEETPFFSIISGNIHAMLPRIRM